MKPDMEMEKEICEKRLSRASGGGLTKRACERETSETSAGWNLVWLENSAVGML